MALSPIQMFQNNGSNSIEGLLRAGPEAISNIMNQAIQIGRSMSDKQLAQERDLFAMRDRETQLAQRRAENTQQDMEDAQRFNRGVFESDRRFAAETGDEIFNRNRVTANDVFSQGIDKRQMDLSEKKFNTELDMIKEEKRVKAENILNFNEQYGGTPTAGASGPAPVDPPLGYGGMPEASGAPGYAAAINDKQISSPTAFNAQRMFGTPPPSEDLPTLRADIKLLEEQVDKPPAGASPEAVRNAAIRLERMREQEVGLTRKTDTDAAPKAPTAAAERKGIDNLLMNRKFFQPQQSFLKPDSTKDDIDKAKNWDDNKFEAEANAAVDAVSKKAYVDAGGDKSPASVEARGRFYDYAVKTLGGGNSTTTPPPESPWNNPAFR